MKHQALFLRKTKVKIIKVLSATISLGASWVKRNHESLSFKGCMATFRK